jgi:predicted O-linked N-acetylglucosamine transferase (SPINDLY family)
MVFGAAMNDPSAAQRDFALALQHHQAGRLPEAERLYRQILSQNPQHANALQNMGILAGQLGRNDQALDLSRRVVTLKPNSAEAYSNLGNALFALGRSDEAVAAYRQAIALNPNFAEAHYNLGNVVKSSGRLAEAIEAFRRAVALKPDYVDAQNNLGNALAAIGQAEEAFAVFHRAIALQPKIPQTYFNFGYALANHGRLDEAIALFRQAIALRPNYPEAYSSIGNVLKEKGELDQAIAAHRQALALNPNLFKACNNLGVALQAKGQLDEAITALRHAIALNPNYAEACNNLGMALKDAGRLDETIAAFRQAITFRPDFSEAHSNLVLTLHYHEGYDADAIAEEHRLWNRKFAQPLAKFIRPHSNDRDPNRRLRIGYVSPDFKIHVVGRFLLPLLSHHDRGHFEIFCYSNAARPDEMTARFRSIVDHWRDIARISDEQAADAIRADGIDILVDLAGHTAGNRLLVFAQKPAPVQVSYLGYPASTGLNTIDYRLSDVFADPADSPNNIYRLPRTNWCFAKLEDSGPVQPPPAINQGYVTFGSFNTLPKVTDAMLQVWARILREIPGSHLLLKTSGFAAASVRERIGARLTALGIDASRLSLRGFEPANADHLAMYSQIDIALDTFPYHGTTTTCDALWMGVPVVTLAGQTHVSRVGVSLLSNIGMPELIAHSTDEYARIAIDLARDLDRLQSLRQSMRARMIASPLMDANQFARDIEAAYRQMWQNWCAAMHSED